MSLDDWHLTFVLICTILMVAAFTPIVSVLLQAREEPFFAMAILGENGTAEHYYPNDDPNIKVGNETYWFIDVYNHMGSSQYISIRVKILNSTLSSPNSTLCKPSDTPEIFEIRRILFNNQTLSYPFNWSLQKVADVNNSKIITDLTINDEHFQSSVNSINGYNYRFVIELWVYDQLSDDFGFGWTSRGEQSCVWNQIWFNSTSTM